MKLGLYVGSFNPVHNGHLKVINYLLDNNIVDKVIVLPTPNYWDKQNLLDLKLLEKSYNYQKYQHNISTFFLLLL